MKMSYDERADVMYISMFDSTDKCVYVDRPDDGYVLRLEPDGERVVGITIPFFLRRLEGGLINILEVG